MMNEGIIILLVGIAIGYFYGGFSYWSLTNSYRRKFGLRPRKLFDFDEE